MKGTGLVWIYEGGAGGHQRTHRSLAQEIKFMKQETMEEKHGGGKALGEGCPELPELVSYQNGDLGQATRYPELLSQMCWGMGPIITCRIPLWSGSHSGSDGWSSGDSISCH